MLFGFNSFAKSSSKASDSVDLSGYILIQSEAEAWNELLYSEEIKLQCLQKLSSKMLVDRIPEIECTDVIIKNTIFKSYVNFYRARLLTEIYCKPRSYSDTVLMSLFKKCKESPQQDCFNPQLISQLNQVKRTTVTEINLGDCDFSYLRRY